MWRGKVKLGNRAGISVLAVWVVRGLLVTRMVMVEFVGWEGRKRRRVL